MSATPFTVTFFDHRSARFKRELQVTLPELREMIEAQAADSTEAGRSRGLAAPYERRTHTSRVMLVLTDIAIVHVKC